MRIFSKFHDYYDSCLAYGADPKASYTRNEREYTPRKNWPVEVRTVPLRVRFRSVVGRFLGRWPEYGQGIILFCGRVYPYVCFCKQTQSVNPLTKQLDRTKEFVYCYTIGQITEFFSKHGSKEEKLQYFKPMTRKENSFRRAFELFFQQNQMPERTVIDILFKIKSPCINIITRIPDSGNDKLVVNPELKKLQFYRIVDAYTAFQELSMFISGVMGGSAPPMIEISDKIRAEKHGFDKWSFRRKKEL